MGSPAAIKGAPEDPAPYTSAGLPAPVCREASASHCREAVAAVPKAALRAMVALTRGPSRGVLGVTAQASADCCA